MPVTQFILPRDPNPLGAPLRNREPAAAPATMTSVIDETLHIVAGSVLDLSGWRGTAVPAGSLGRVTVSGRQMLEGGVAKRWNIAHLQPENTYTPLPADRAAIDAGVAYLARCGYNCIRIMGIEHLVMRGIDGAAIYNAELMDRFDYLLAACKAQGLYWVLCVQSYNLFMDLDGTNNRFSYTAATNCKQRIFTEQNVRDNWAAGVHAFYNRVNPHTGINILQDPALLLLELYNEASSIFCGSLAWPATWVTRNAGATVAAQTWGEWLADTSKGHGYANLAALNASWGTAHASYSAAAAASVPLLDVTVIPQTQQAVDALLYTQYLEGDLHGFYVSALASMGYTGLRSMHCMYPQAGEIREAHKYSANDVVNKHHYVNLINDPAPGGFTQSLDQPLWEYEYTGLMHLWAGGAKPLWLGEMGNVAWSTWRHHFALIVAAAASSGASSVSFFTQADPFYPAYYDDETNHGNRFRMLDSFPSAGGHCNDFLRPLFASIFLRQDVTEMTGAAVDIPFNDRYLGTNPRNTFRAKYYYLSGLPLPLYPLVALTKCRLTWTSDTTDDTLATTWIPKAWHTMLAEIVGTGAITNTHPTYLSAVANNGTVTAIATTGTVGGLAATPAQPVLTLSAAHTLVDNDVIHVWGISGTAGNNYRNARIRVKVGTGNNVRCESGMDLTSHSGYATATWSEGGNVLVSGHQQWGMSRREKRGWINTSKTVYLATTTGASFPMTLGHVIVTSMTADCSLFVVSADGQPISSSARLIVGLVGVAENTGMSFTDATRKTIVSMGDYPVKQLDATAALSIGVTLPQSWTLYRLQRSGARGSAETLTSIDASTGRLVVTLRTGTVQPACLWELVR